MSKYNRLTQAVFSDIVKTDNRLSLYERFLNVDTALEITTDELLDEFKDQYQHVTNVLRKDLNALAKMEEVIIQMRCKKLISENMKISIGRGYIYARTLFYRGERDVKDIRVLVDSTKDWGDDPKKLIGDPFFMNIAKRMLIDAMDKHIDANLKVLHKTCLDVNA